MKLWLTSVLLCLLLGTTAAFSMEQEDGLTTQDQGDLHQATECPALLGNETVQELNAKRREKLIHWMDREPAGITVAHSNHHWREPSHLVIHGLKLLEIRAEPSERHAAILEVDPELARSAGCAPGKYIVHQDNTLGSRIRVLGIFPRAVLLEQDTGLAFMNVDGERRPRWFLAWRLRTTLHTLRSSGGSSAPRRKAAPKPRPRTPPPKKHPRRK